MRRLRAESIDQQDYKETNDPSRFDAYPELCSQSVVLPPQSDVTVGYDDTLVSIRNKVERMYLLMMLSAKLDVFLQLSSFERYFSFSFAVKGHLICFIHSSSLMNGPHLP